MDDITQATTEMTDSQKELLKNLNEYDWNALKNYARDLGLDTYKKTRDTIIESILKYHEDTGYQSIDTLEATAQEELTSLERLSRLIRCKVINQNHHETKLHSKLFTVGNMVDGFLPSRVVTFGKVTHLPASLVDHLQNTTYRHAVTKVNAKGHKYTVNEALDHYNVVILPPLTKIQLRELAKEQKATGRIED